MLTHQQRHFDRLYRHDPDPWGYRTTWAEQHRLGVLIATLDQPLYGRVFEPGCANGTLTELLAARSTHLVSWDSAPAAVDLTRAAVTAMSGVSCDVGSVPDDWPDGSFDLVVLSDFLYYLSAPDITAVLARATESVTGGGLIMSSHWRGTAADFLTPGGAAVHQVIESALGPPNVASYFDQHQVIGLWRP